MVQGLGYALMEELRAEAGQIATLSLGEYKIPTIKDMPELVTVLLEPGPGPAPYQSKGIGESSNTPVAATRLRRRPDHDTAKSSVMKAPAAVPTR
jgi:CO/xanthine dehydrogenase Mo-binding subunit